jgi:protein SCO1/2
MKRLLLPLALVVLAVAGWFVLRPHGEPEEPLDRGDIGAVPDFALTDQNGNTVRRDDLLGKVWVADCVFTRCSGPCPMITANLSRLGHDLAGHGLDEFRLVTVTVDPDHDTPEVLAAYARKFDADPARWVFLTGKKAEVYDFIQKGLLQPVMENEGEGRKPGSEVLHSVKLMVVDRKGHLRGYFDGRTADNEGRPVDELPKVRQLVEKLLREKP